MSTAETIQRGFWDVRAAASAAAAEPAPVGLSTCHISPQAHLRKARVTIAIGGNTIKLTGPELAGDTMRAKALRHRQTTRGSITEFSKRSRHRLLFKLGNIDQRQILYRPLMATLTYGDDWPTSPVKWKRDLQALVKRILRRYPSAAIIWRMEPQKRGAPHFHLLIFNLRFLPFGQVAQWWADITNGNPASCSRVERVRSWRGVMSYASKYLAKLDGDNRQFLSGPNGKALSEVGRLWGVINAEALPTDVREFIAEDAQFHQLRRILHRHKSSILRRAGHRHIPAPRDPTVGFSSFLDWETSIQLVDGQLGGDRLIPLLRETRKLEMQARFKREALAEEWLSTRKK
jgi:hypothetical protein